VRAGRGVAATDQLLWPRLRIRDARQTFWHLDPSVLENKPFEVWGGEQLRDLTYVDDVTEAFLRAGDARMFRWHLQSRGAPRLVAGVGDLW